MIRWLGAVLVLAGGVWMGLERRGQRGARVRALRGLSAALDQMERELRGREPPLSRLLDGVSGSTPWGRFFAACRDGLERREDQPFVQVWGEALARAELPLTEEERALLEELGGVLGRYDQASQCRLLQSAAEGLDRRAEQAARERERLGRLDWALGAAGGLLLVILLF